MSTTYIHEPPTNGKVLLTTTCGDIDIELWSKEAPRACRNFVQLCLEGYYDGTIFHRIIRGFMAQGGDPTGTGEGGESCYGHTFKDEFHSRLKFVRRGLVAMANAGPSDNGSQFFFTFDRCEHLNNKHTIFGKVVGNTIYNMIKLEDVEVDGDDRPLYPAKIKSTEVLANPFDDIVPRQLKKDKDKDVKKKRKAKGTKNFSLLSFGEEAEEDEEEVNEASLKMKHKSKSAHDLGIDPNLSSAVAVEVEKAKSSPTEEDKDAVEEDEQNAEDKRPCDDEMRESIRKKLKKSSDKPTEKTSGLQEDASDDRESRRKELHKESDRLKRELRETQRKENDSEKNDGDDKKPQHDNDKEDLEKAAEPTQPTNDMLTEFRQQKKRFRQIKKTQATGGNREDQTLAILAKFQNHLHQVNQEENSDDGGESGEEKEEEQEQEEEREDDDGGGGEVLGTGWMTHVLKCEMTAVQVKDANIKDADTYSIYDPRNPINKRRRDEGKKKSKERK